MIRQTINVEGYWKVIVYWNVDYHFFDSIKKDLIDIHISKQQLKTLWYNMYYRKAKAVTFSNEKLHTSIVLFNCHYSKGDYINSIVHEAEHVKQAMLEAYAIDDSGEPPAYTIGYLVSQMYSVFKNFICSK